MMVGVRVWCQGTTGPGAGKTLACQGRRVAGKPYLLHLGPPHLLWRELALVHHGLALDRLQKSDVIVVDAHLLELGLDKLAPGDGRLQLQPTAENGKPGTPSTHGGAVNVY